MHSKSPLLSKKSHFKRVCRREKPSGAALLTGVHTALQLWLFTEPKGSFNLGSITLRVNKHKTYTQRGSAARNLLLRAGNRDRADETHRL